MGFVLGLGNGIVFRQGGSQNWSSYWTQRSEFWGKTIDLVNNRWLGKSGNYATFKNASARTSASGNLDYVITGLLTTDTVEVVTGSDTPTIPLDGTLRIAEGDVVFGVTIKRAGVAWAIIPFCEPVYNTIIPTTSYDVSGNGHHAVCATLVSGNITTQDDYFYLLQHGYNYKKNKYTANFSSGVDSFVVAWGTAGAGTCASDGEKVNFVVTSQPSSSATSRPLFSRNNTLTVGIKTRLILRGTGLISGYNWGSGYVNTDDIDLAVQDWIVEFTPTATTLYLYFNGQARNTFSISEVIIDQYFIVPGAGVNDALGTPLEVTQDGTKWLKYSGDILLPSVVNKPKLSTIMYSGLCVAGKKYFVETTEVDHFGVGVESLDIFTAGGTEVIDENNTIREVLSDNFFSDGSVAIEKSFTDFNSWRAHLYYCKMDEATYDEANVLQTSMQMSELLVLKDSVYISSAKHLELKNYFNLSQSVDFPLVAFSWDHTTPTEIPLLAAVFGDIKQTYFINYAGYLTNNQIIDLSNSGHEVGLHTWWDETLGDYPPERKGFHEIVANYSQAQLDDYYNKARTYYRGVLGYNIVSKAYPGGQSEAFTRTLCLEYFSFGRGTSATLTVDNIQKIPFTRFSNVNSESLDIPKYSEIAGFIDSMITAGMRFLSIYGHPGTWDGTKYSASGAVDAGGKDQYGWMTDILAYIRTKQNAGAEVRIVTLKQLTQIIKQEV